MTLKTNLIAALGILLLSGSALAQKSALIQDRDSPGRAPYQSTNGFNPSTSTCPNDFYCVLAMKPVPAGQRLVVTYASGEFTLPNGLPAAVYVHASPNVFADRIIVPHSTQAGTRTYAAGQVTFYIDGPATPALVYTGTGVISSSSAFGTVVGYLVTIP